MPNTEHELTFRGSIQNHRLRRYLGDLACFIEECRIEITHDGWEVQAEDADGITLVDALLAQDAFTTYETTGETIGVNPTTLIGILDQFAPEREIHISYNTDRHELTLDSGAYSYTYPIVVPDSIRRGVDFTVTLPATVSLGSARLATAVLSFDEFADEVTIGIDTDENEVLLEAEGDYSTGECRIAFDDLPRPPEVEEEEVRSTFASDRLVLVVETLPAAELVTIDLGNDVPMRVSYPLDGGEIQLTLAPIIH